ncbi:MAG TPA: caspase family protein, partial [Kiritimatiellia bacterium]|nr:caspase family protein [Kiritimatiellia bacterium]
MKKVLKIGLMAFLALAGIASAANYGVFVGLNKYNSSYIGSDSWLNGCVPDANHVYTNAILRGDWTAGTVTKLLDSAGTKAAIRTAISNGIATAVSGDTFFYYHSSHGGQNSGKSVYLCTYNADYQDTELAADLAKFASGVKVIVMVDACHSGGLFQSVKAGTRALAPASGGWDLAGNVTRLIEEIRTGELARGAKDAGKLISASEIGWVTAANYDQYSWDGDSGGLFTDKVIEGWTNAPASSCDLNGDKYANFWELYKYASNVAYNADYEYTTAMAYNTNVLLGSIAGWIGSAAPGGLVTFSNLADQVATVGQTLVVPVGAYTSGTTTPAVVTMSTVQAGASYGGGNLTFTPPTDGVYVFNFSATNATGGSASATLTVNALLAAPPLLAATGIGNDRFTANWSAVAGAASYALDVATATSFSPGGSGALSVLASNLNTGLSTGWEYVNGASNAGTYHKLITATDPGVVSPSFSTVGFTNALAGFSVATFGGSTANGLVVSYSLDGGSTWTRVGTNTSATASSPYVAGSMDLPAGALGQAGVRVKWHCPGATGSIGIRLQNLAVSGAQPAGASTLVVNGQGVAGTSQTVTGLAMGTPYYWRVRAVGNLNGPYSATGTVTTTAADSAPA